VNKYSKKYYYLKWYYYSLSFSFLTHPQTPCSPTPSRKQKLGLKRKKERMKGIFIVQLFQSQVLQMPSYPTPCFLTLSSPISCSPNPTFLQPKPLQKTKNLRLKTQKERRKRKGFSLSNCSNPQVLQIPSYPTPYSPNPRLSNPMFSKPQVIQPHVLKPWVSKP